MHFYRYLLGLVLLVGFLPSILLAGSLRMENYAEVLVENLQVGNSYSMKSLVNLPLKVINDSDKDIIIAIEAVKPQGKYIKPGYKPIPDISWVEFGNTITAMAPHQLFKTDVKLSIPKEKEYYGQKYQIDIRCRTISQSMVSSISLAVQGRMLFTTAPEGVGSVNPGTTNLDYSLAPMRVEVKDIKLGIKTEVMFGEKPVMLKNKSKSPLVFEILSLNPERLTLKIEAGCKPAPNSEYLTIENDKITLAPGEEKPLNMFIEIPNKRKYRNKKYQFVVSVLSGNATRYLRVIVSTMK